LQVREEVRLSDFTTLGVGGPARFFCTLYREQDLKPALEIEQSRVLPILILGGGSNLLVADTGFSGIVIHMGMRGIAFDADRDDVIVSAKAGENWDSLVALCAEKNLAGIENLSGIPGYVGATPIQNVGAYGQEVGTTIESVRAWDRVENRIATLGKSDCEFGYRTSVFNSRHRDRYVILEVVYRLRSDGSPNLKYRDLADYFSSKKEKPSLENIRTAVLNIRRSKAMVIDPNNPDSRSAGSFFKNPIVSTSQLQKIRTISETDVPAFPAGDQHKVSAAWLIEQAGFSRGYVKGRAGISSKHSLAIINRGGASASEIVALAKEMHEGVKALFEIELEAEPVLVGF